MTKQDKNKIPYEDWVPRGKQAKILHEAQVATLGVTITKLCQRAGVSRNTFYNWLKKDAHFRQAWRSVHLDGIERYMPMMTAAQVNKALKGDTQAYRTLSEVAGKIVKQLDVTSGGAPVKLYDKVGPDDWDEETEGDDD